MSNFHTEVVHGKTYMHVGKVHDWEVYMEKHFYENHEHTCKRLLDFLNEKDKHFVYEKCLVRDEKLYYPPNTGFVGSVLGSSPKYTITWKMRDISVFIERAS